MITETAAPQLVGVLPSIEASLLGVRVEEPFPDFAIPRIWSWTQEFRHRVCSDDHPASLAAFVEHWEAAERAGRRSWAAYFEGELGGAITSLRVSPAARVSPAVAILEISLVFARRFWGDDTALQAAGQVCAQLFAEGATKIMSMAFRDNRSVIGMWHKLGGVVEGTLREQTLRGGKPTDMVLLGLRKGQFRGVVHDGQDGANASASEVVDSEPEPESYRMRRSEPIPERAQRSDGREETENGRV